MRPHLAAAPRPPLRTEYTPPPTLSRHAARFPFTVIHCTSRHTDGAAQGHARARSIGSAPAETASPTLRGRTKPCLCTSHRRQISRCDTRSRSRITAGFPKAHRVEPLEVLAEEINALRGSLKLLRDEGIPDEECPARKRMLQGIGIHLQHEPSARAQSRGRSHQSSRDRRAERRCCGTGG